MEEKITIDYKILIRKKWFAKLGISDYETGSIDLEVIKYLIENSENITDPSKRKWGLQQVKKMSEMQLELVKFWEKRALMNEEVNKTSHAFITFKTPQIRNRVLNDMGGSKCKMCCLKYCCTKKLDIRRLRGSCGTFILNATVAPEPETILWANLGKSACEKYTRRTISWLIMLVFLTIPFIIVIFCSHYISSNSTESSVECPELLTSAEAFADYQSTIATTNLYGGLGYIDCYCMEDLSGRLNEAWTLTTGDLSGTSKTLCKDLSWQILQNTTLGFLMSAILAFFSGLCDIVLMKLSFFECYNVVTDQYWTRIIKSFIWKYINAGLIILFINNVRISLFGVTIGDYDDFTPTWFSNIGFSVVISFLLQIIVLFGWSCVAILVPKLKQCCDRGCRLKMIKANGKPYTKKNSQQNYEKVYEGAMFRIAFSYSEFLKAFFMCITFGPIMPFVYIIGFFFIGLL